jgi:hypothetical protein
MRAARPNDPELSADRLTVGRLDFAAMNCPACSLAPELTAKPTLDP